MGVNGSADHSKPVKDKLIPTLTSERALEEGRGAAASATAWRWRSASPPPCAATLRRRIPVSRYEQEAERKAMRAAFPASAAIHSHLRHEGLAWLDKP
jgi:hypothetical protein